MIPKQFKQDGFPRCVSLSITFNDHAVMYQTVEEWLEASGEQQDWVSDEEKARAIKTGSIWVCHWYPDTPVGSCSLAASSFDVLMRAVNG